MRTVDGGRRATVRHPIHADPALGPQHRFADLAGRPVAAAGGLAVIRVRFVVVREPIVVVVIAALFGRRFGPRARRRFVVSAACPSTDTCPPSAAAAGKPAARLFAPVRRRVQAVAGRLGRVHVLHQRHPRHVHVLFDAHAQGGAEPGRSRRQFARAGRQRVAVTGAVQRFVDVLLTVLRLTVTVVCLVPDVATDDLLLLTTTFVIVLSVHNSL